MSYRTRWSRYVRRYAFVIIGIALVMYLAGRYFNYSLRSSGATVIPMVVAVMLEGMAFAREERTLPSGSWAWQQSALFGLVGLAVSIAFAAFFMSAFPGGLGLFLAPVGFEALSGMTVVMAGVIVLGARLVFWFGAWNALKLRAPE